MDDQIQAGQIDPSTQYAVTPIPAHSHTGSDSLRVDIASVARFPSSPSKGDLVYYDGGQWKSLTAGTVGYFVKSNGANSAPSYAAPNFKFGGTGSDGALSLISGTTTIDVGGAALFVKNYTSISISNASLVFSNPAPGGTCVVLKSQGNVSLTTSAQIDIRAMGSAGGTNGSAGGSLANGTAGSNGTAPNRLYFGGSPFGLGGAKGVNPGTSNPAGGIGGTQVTAPSAYADQSMKAIFVVPGVGGAGGGGGGGGQGTTPNGGNGGSGGNGGGALLIECAGAWNFATGTSILAQGSVGVNGSNGQTGSLSGGGGGGAGGGGSGGMVVVLYNSLTANSGTISLGGGTGGTGGTGGGGNNTTNSAGSGGAGGAGAGFTQGAGGSGGTGGTRAIEGGALCPGGSGGAGGVPGSAGNNGDQSGGGAGFNDKGGGGGGGGGGCDGYSIVALNTEFA